MSHHTIFFGSAQAVFIGRLQCWAHWRCKIVAMPPVIVVSQRDELVEGLMNTEILSVRGSKISKLQAIKGQEPRVRFAAPLDLQLEFSLVGCH